MSAEHVVAIVEAALRGDRGRVSTVALQYAAHQGRAGRQRVAERVRRVVGLAVDADPADKVPPQLADILELRARVLPLAEVVLSDEIQAGVDTLLVEQAAADALHAHGLSPAHRVAMVGPPGCGKTTLAGAIASALERPFYVLRETLIVSHLGETSSRLAKALDFVSGRQCVLLVDEMDGIATSRDLNQEVQEMRRVLMALMTRLERLPSHTVVLAATNSPDRVDAALWRRFDAVWRWPDCPSSTERRALVNRLVRRHGVGLNVAGIPGTDAGSLAEVERVVLQAMKRHVMDAYR